MKYPENTMVLPDGLGKQISSDPPRLALRPREAAKALGVSERTLWSMTKAGKIPHARMDRIVMYPVDALRKWLDEMVRGGQA